MLLVHHRVRLAVAALLALAAGAAGGACDPTPTFPAPAQPLVGTVVFERELTMGTDPVEIKNYAATIDIAPGTVPVGTKLVVRILDGVVKDLTPFFGGPHFIPPIWTIDGQPASVQLISDVPTFARPIILTVQSFWTPDETVDVLHADESATAWTRVGTATLPKPPPSAFTAALTEPHLWTMAMPLPGEPALPAPAPDGPYLLNWLTCDANGVVPTPAETLEIDGDRYAWTHGAAGDACASVERGAIVLDVEHDHAAFMPDEGDAYAFELQIVASNAFSLKAIEVRPRECPAEARSTAAHHRWSPGQCRGGHRGQRAAARTASALQARMEATGRHLVRSAEPREQPSGAGADSPAVPAHG
jgi:hypothetical protein